MFKYLPVVLMPLVLLFGLHLPRITRLHLSIQQTKASVKGHVKHGPAQSHRSQHPSPWIFDIF